MHGFPDYHNGAGGIQGDRDFLNKGRRKSYEEILNGSATAGNSLNKGSASRRHSKGKNHVGTDDDQKSSFHFEATLVISPSDGPTPENKKRGSDFVGEGGPIKSPRLSFSGPMISDVERTMQATQMEK